jgi:hypothetical protein
LGGFVMTGDDLETLRLERVEFPERALGAGWRAARHGIRISQVSDPLRGLGLAARHFS